MYDSLDISKVLLSKINTERFETIGDGISNLKLQKLLFYIQKTSVSVFDNILFSDEMQAWQYGPVAPKAYHRFKAYQNGNIDIIDERDFIEASPTLSFNELLVVDFVWDRYSQYSAGKLVDLTHQDKAWIDNYIPGINNHIEKKDLKDKELEKSFNDYLVSLETASELVL